MSEAPFGLRLKNLRLAKGITQNVLADYMNVTVVTVCHWEKSKQEPCIEDLKKLCEFFDVPSSLLFGF